MKLKYTFENVDLGNETVAVPVGEGADKVHGVIKLNKSGLEIFKYLEAGDTPEGIANSLSEKYGDDSSVIYSYVMEIISILKEADLIED